MTIKHSKLSLKKESLRALSDKSLEQAGGGFYRASDFCEEGSFVAASWVPSAQARRLTIAVVVRDLTNSGAIVR
jgi:hypothetical protein